MTTTAKNHKILLKFLEENSDSLRIQQCNLQAISVEDKKISKADIYWSTVMENNFSMKELFDFYITEEEIDCLIDNEEIEQLNKILDFKIRYFQEHMQTREKNGFVFIGEKFSGKEDRIPKKAFEGNIAYLYDEPYLSYEDTDYETAIELVHTKEYTVPAYAYIKLNSNTFLADRDYQKDRFLYKKKSSYVGYGTQWM